MNSGTSSRLRTCSRAVGRPRGSPMKSSTWSLTRFGGDASGTRIASGTPGGWSLRMGPGRGEGAAAAVHRLLSLAFSAIFSVSGATATLLVADRWSRLGPITWRPPVGNWDGPWGLYFVCETCFASTLSEDARWWDVDPLHLTLVLGGHFVSS